ncbi:MAG TPA: hypothetical protein VFW75_01030 [Acetobacteraceae bacterium]|nr:hypothetical protein [Acetobacteraceae bacterium]
MPHAEDATAQIAKLREQVEVLMRERVTPALADVAGRAETAMGAVKDQAEALSGRVRDQPIIAVLVAVGVGFLIGRVLR